MPKRHPMNSTKNFLRRCTPIHALNKLEPLPPHMNMFNTVTLDLIA